MKAKPRYIKYALPLKCTNINIGVHQRNRVALKTKRNFCFPNYHVPFWRVKIERDGGG